MRAPFGRRGIPRNMNIKPVFELDDLLSVLPHRPPFLFIDRVVKLDLFKSIVAERRLRPEEPQFAGHFPHRPIMPGVLVTEALAQTSGLLMGLSERITGLSTPASPKMFYLAANTMKVDGITKDILLPFICRVIN